MPNTHVRNSCVVASAFRNASQTCICTDRTIVQVSSPTVSRPG